MLIVTVDIVLVLSATNENGVMIVCAADGVEVAPASVEGCSSLGVHCQAWKHLLQGTVGEEQAVHCSTANHRDVPRSVEEALLYTPRKVSLHVDVISFWSVAL